MYKNVDEGRVRFLNFLVTTILDSDNGALILLGLLNAIHHDVPQPFNRIAQGT
jgi:hypothetical protein